VSLSATAKWVLLALLGLAIAIAIAIAAANLTSRQIGIASESVSAGDALAPALNVRPEGKPHGNGNTPRTTTTEEPSPPEETSSEETTTPDDHGGGDSDGDDD